ncbi:NAD synthetase [Flavobacterium sp. 316]|uniref:NH(3)-dependent NAD(+) synthetase n=1 Tax=Flavobacterium sediminilitoris TaxID=2024526 RepID=A0ABY4HNB1_9FLAO|nr:MULTISPECIES: NAD(+) synthase [Flavobacterium]KIX21831.1 NAD synthetase [Flavobacterium sp. 316]UOX34349.1 NAD(+) synthase [Flavobacterium sediminilitoris]
MTNSNSFNAEKINQHIVKWLLDYATNAKVKGFVVGISGGIDSALTSTLCAQTGLPTLCVEMPIHQAESHVNRANEHINQLKSRFSNVTNERADLTPVFETFKHQVTSSENEAVLNLSLANVRARLRMTTLYYFAGIHGLLVTGTGNKIEDFGVGFFTKYGDGGVDLSPIADLMKSEVRLLAKYLHVPESILKAKPTDGLFGDDRSDEDQIGANYEELEWAMLESEKGKTEDDFSGRQATVFSIYTRLNTINQHKMIPIPVCIIPKILKQI